MNVKDVAIYTNLSPRTIYNFVFFKKIPFERISEKKVIFYKNEIDKWLEQRRKEQQSREKSNWIQTVIDGRQIKKIKKQKNFISKDFISSKQNILLFTIYFLLSFTLGWLANHAYYRYMKKEILQSAIASPSNELRSIPLDIKSLIEQSKIRNIQVKPYSFLDNEEVEIKLDNVSNIELKGKATSDYIMPLLLYALKNKEEDYATKSITLDIIKPFMDDKNINDALIYVAKNDKSPAIRMKAISFLSEKVKTGAIKDAILDILKNDENEAVRFRALEVLERIVDDQIITVLIKVKEQDESKIIRDRANLIYRKHQNKHT